MADPLSEAVEWYLSSRPSEAGAACSTRDLFQARLDTKYREIMVQGLLGENDAALLTAVLGEIGNNCFDHNLGRWRDMPGCFFGCYPERSTILAIIADRGQGILNSLKQVRPGLATETEALKTAFEVRISGRSPERRGNGLKFVRSVINGFPNRGLIFFSGNERIRFGHLSLEKTLAAGRINNAGTGTLALIGWRAP